MSDWRILTEELWSVRRIYASLHEGKCFWVVDEKFNFSLMRRKNIVLILIREYKSRSVHCCVFAL